MELNRKLGRKVEVTESSIVAACEELCGPQGDPQSVSALRVRSIIGGGAERVNDIVRRWREGKITAAQAPQPASSEAGDLPVEIAQALQTAHGSLDDLSRRFREGLAATVHEERRRAVAAAQVAEQAATVRLEQEKMRAARAEEETECSARNLDQVEFRAEQAEAEARGLHAALAEAQETARTVTSERDRLADDCDRLRAEVKGIVNDRAREAELREEAERTRDALGTQIAALAREHAATVETEQVRHRQERDADKARAERRDARIEEQAARIEELQEGRRQLLARVEQLEARRSPQRMDRAG